jgi:hypothetical protein
VLQEHQKENHQLNHQVSNSLIFTNDLKHLIRDPQALVFKGDHTKTHGELSLPSHKQMNRINSFTLTGNSSLHFELSRDPTELIGAIFWQLKRIKIEKYNPVFANGGAPNQGEMPHQNDIHGNSNLSLASTQGTSCASSQGSMTSSAKTAKMTSENHLLNMHRALQE